MATRKEIQAQIDKLTADLEGADTDDVVWVRDPETRREVQISGRRATSLLKKLGLAEDEAAAGEQDGEGEGEGEGEEGGEDGKSVWGRKRS